MYTIGERLKHLRTFSNMKQSDIAEKIGVSTSNISRIEKNEISPSATIVLQICKSFDVSTDWPLNRRNTFCFFAILYAEFFGIF